jgi:hypothetical protein
MKVIIEEEHGDVDDGVDGDVDGDVDDDGDDDGDEQCLLTGWRLHHGIY